MPKLIDLTGQRFGRLTVLERNPDWGKNAKWKCLCDCGSKISVLGSDLRKGHTKSCGCLRKEEMTIRSTMHKGVGTRLYNIWRGMKQRCYDPSAENFKNYGGRGIKVCDKWLHDFKAFRDWALSHGYRDDLTIDRIDNDKGYCPDNCRWATRHEQRINQRPPKRKKEM